MAYVTRIRFGKRNLGVLSPLESDVLKIMWKNPDSWRVRDIHSTLKKRRKVALTSVAVILDRLHAKKIVTRKINIGRGGEYYIYSCQVCKEDFQQTVVEKTVDKLIDNFGDVAVNYFNERFSKDKKGG
ncbi:BlaI/MecI/CopY family transcriptional regulator [Candidatus Woesearchaeota archaeon]|nr:BlaI/MecI/CopY family transcriptional regulator [Candidatus Woesearchaeota archaeon]